MTNAGEYLAGAYYSICRDYNYILYNQGIFFDISADAALPYNWTKQKLQAIFNDEHFYMDRVEIDVIADGECRIIAECTERPIENRSIDKIRRKFYGALAFDAMNGTDTNLTLELWAPSVSDTLREEWPSLKTELQGLHKQTDSEYSNLKLELVTDDIYKERLNELLEKASGISHNKIDNPVFRTFQLLKRAGIINR